MDLPPHKVAPFLAPRTALATCDWGLEIWHGVHSENEVPSMVVPYFWDVFDLKNSGGGECWQIILLFFGVWGWANHRLSNFPVSSASAGNELE